MDMILMLKKDCLKLCRFDVKILFRKWLPIRTNKHTCTSIDTDDLL